MRYEVSLKFKCESREFINRILDQIETDDALKLLTFELNQNPDYVPSLPKAIQKKAETVAAQKIVEPAKVETPAPVVSEDNFVASAPVVTAAEKIISKTQEAVHNYKPKNIPRSVPNISVVVSQSDVTEEVSDLEAPKKRGPGRPPKNAAPAPAPVVSATVEPKRGPGRPPKVKPETQPVFVNPDRQPMTEGHYQVGVEFGEQGEPEFTAQPLAASQVNGYEYEDSDYEEEVIEQPAPKIVQTPNLKPSQRASRQITDTVEYTDPVTGKVTMIGAREVSDAFLYASQELGGAFVMKFLSGLGVDNLRNLPPHHWGALYQLGMEAKRDIDARNAEVERRSIEQYEQMNGAANVNGVGHSRYSNGRSYQ